MKNLTACATDSIKIGANQDACGLVNREQFRGVIVADGIGSHYKAEEAARFCVTCIQKKIEAHEQADALDFTALFQETESKLIEFVNTSFDDLEGIDRGKAFGTTLICAIETDTEFLMAYSGNGSIWHLHGNFNSFSPARYLPWNSINLLNPHSVEEGGKAALYRYLSIANGCSTPTIIRINKNASFGDIIIISTDGIYSYDQVLVGKDPDGAIWVSGEESMNLLFQTLSRLIKDEMSSLNESKLTYAIQSYLSLLKEKGVMYDDCTLGVIISECALQYHQRQMQD